MMKKTNPRVGKIFIVFAVICMVFVPLIILSAFMYEPEEIKPEVMVSQGMDFDQNGEALFKDYNRISREYMEGASTQRTLSQYYALRQYPGSPPYIPHKVDAETEKKLECLTCHEKGGWTEELKRNTPLTPHPEQTNCTQCHVKPEVDSLFVENNWMSVPPPRLGRSHLPGAPPPIAHDLHGKGNCIACHVGPGAVVNIRVEHPSRGNCRQCHVPDLPTAPFKRKS